MIVQSGCCKLWEGDLSPSWWAGGTMHPPNEHSWWRYGWLSRVVACHPPRLCYSCSLLHIPLEQTFNSPYRLLCMCSLIRMSEVNPVWACPARPSPLLVIIMVHATWHLRCLVFLCTNTPILDILIKDLWYNTPVSIVNSKWLGCLIGHEVEMHPLQPGGPRKVLVCKDYLKVTI